MDPHSTSSAHGSPENLTLRTAPQEPAHGSPHALPPHGGTEQDAIHRASAEGVYVCMTSARTERDRGCVATRGTEKVLSKGRDTSDWGFARQRGPGWPGSKRLSGGCAWLKIEPGSLGAPATRPCACSRRRCPQSLQGWLPGSCRCRPRGLEEEVAHGGEVVEGQTGG